MNHRSVTVAAWALGLSCVLSSPEVAAGGPPPGSGPIVENQPRFIHTVLFWLKPGVSSQQKEQLIRDCKELLGGISTVRYLAAGEPAGTPRSVVDNSYHVGLVVHFDDPAGHDVYQSDPKHQAFIQRNQAIWERVQVYDVIAR